MSLSQTLPECVLDMIFSFLPASQRSKISNKYYEEEAPKAKQIIVRAMRSARIRMTTIMNHELACSTNVMRAHYILHYPEEHRLEYVDVVMAIMFSEIMRRRPDGSTDPRSVKFIEFVQETNNTELTVKYKFRKLITMMTMEDLVKCGW